MRRATFPNTGPTGARLDSAVDLQATTAAELQRRFHAFRRANDPHTRIPESLRAAAVSALQHGVARQDLQRVCGISSRQLDGWVASQPRRGVVSVPRVPAARVFSVSDAAVDPSPPQHRSGALPEQSLELHIGPWSVSIRLSGQS